MAGLMEPVVARVAHGPRVARADPVAKVVLVVGAARAVLVDRADPMRLATPVQSSPPSSAKR
jgi:hypothetical protein